MNKHLFYGLILLTINYSCAQCNSQEIASAAIMQDSVYVGPTHFSDEVVRDDALYSAIIRVDKQQDNAYVLSVQMNLKKNAYFVSPTENRHFSGKFAIVLSEPQKVLSRETILESPLSKVDEKEGFVHLVRNNTNYKQTIKVLSAENFEVMGHIQFTIEPRCSLEKIPFILTYENGKLRVRMDGC